MTEPATRQPLFRWAGRLGWATAALLVSGGYLFVRGLDLERQATDSPGEWWTIGDNTGTVSFFLDENPGLVRVFTESQPSFADRFDAMTTSIGLTLLVAAAVLLICVLTLRAFAHEAQA